ncbi:MAG: TetR/AcrR family transcriptional regulator [Gammaproteobacteria bacterium]|nr:TetR/AcrR family transcriptional regulator [Gammaproteobacteria bacterium]
MIHPERAARRRQEFARRGEDILDVTERLMLVTGIRRVTVDAIALETGIGKGTIYKHFESKHALLIAVVSRYQQRLIEQVGAIDDPEKQLAAWIRVQLSDPDRGAMMDRLVRHLADDPVARQEMTAGADRMRRVLGKIVSARLPNSEIPPMMVVEWFESLVMGLRTLYASPIRPDGLDPDSLVATAITAIPRLLGDVKRADTAPKVTYL